jgi:hypothetical protein
MKTAAPHRQRSMNMSTEKVTGPRSYFPSIEKTYGRPIDEWLALLASHGGTKHKELVDWLKADHAMGHGHATALVAVFLKPDL